MTTKATDPDAETMVLRTVYLPMGLDEELRKIAFHKEVSKGELIRESIKAWVRSLESERTGVQKKI